ncbi:lipopolysaccharide biosynthesis protein [Agrococcus sp. TSP3-2-1]|uniref:lipopolysaccharide biosynthesis protein n=1 Tax=Agrococcus sp. TSP3-2-1 TaxID=2804583 RepID=UPI003CE851B4
MLDATSIAYNGWCKRRRAGPVSHVASLGSGESVRGGSEYLGRADEGLSAKGALAVVSKVAPGLGTLVTNLLIGRLGGAGLLGLTQTAVSTAALASLVYSSPAAAAASRFVAADVAAGYPERAKAVAGYLSRRVIFATSVLCALGAVALSCAGASNPQAIAVACIMTLGTSARVFVEGLHFGGGKARRLAGWSLAIAVAGVAGSALMLVTGVRSTWVIAPVAVANVVFAVSTWPTTARLKLERQHRLRLKRFLILAAVGTLSSAGFLQLTTLVASAAGGIAFAGAYAAALTLTAPLAIASTAISSTLFPALSAMGANGQLKQAKARVSQATQMLGTVIGAAVCLLIVLSAPVVSVVWGQGYADTWWILCFLLSGTLVTSIAVPSVTSITSASNRGMLVSAASSVLAAGIGLLIWLFLVPSQAELGVIVGCTVATVLTGTIPYAIAWRRFSMAWLRPTAELVGLISLGWASAVAASVGLVDSAMLPFIAALLLLAWCVLRRRDLVQIWLLVGNVRRRR